MRDFAPPRKKACEQCTKAKGRCGLERPCCGRCQSRDLPCKYLTPGPEWLTKSISSGADVTESNQSVPPNKSLPTKIAPRPHGVFEKVDGQDLRQMLQSDNSEFRYNTHPPRKEAANCYVDFTSVDLISVTDSVSIRNRWLQSFLPSSGQRAKILQPHTVQYLCCVFRSYSRQLLRPGCYPPFIHPLQMVNGKLPLSLANCFSLIRTWVTREHGSDALIAETVKSQMQRLFEEHKTYLPMDLLATFQAYLLYATTAFFLPIFNPSVSQTSSLIIDHATMANLQEIACSISLSGLLCTAEATHSRPSWESWIVASTKRRTLYAMYLFDNVFNALNRVPTYIAEELANLPVPASKALWEATQREVWEREYDRHLAAWEGGELTIAELWAPPLPPQHGVGEGGEEVRVTFEQQRERVDRWVQSVDEFGMMLFAVCAHIHGC